MKKKLENYWYHYKYHTLVVLLILFYAVFSGGGLFTKPEQPANYNLGIISMARFGDDELAALKARLEEIYGSAGISVYRIELGADSSDETSRVQLSLLDADLITRKSSDFLLDSVESFIDATNGLEISEAAAVKDIPELAGLGFDELWFVSRR